MIDLTLASAGNLILAIGGLGTAAYGLVDATKALGGGPSYVGFPRIWQAVGPLVGSAGASTPTIFGTADIRATLKANWINGVAKADQKASAKSLIRLALTPDNARALATATGLNPDRLSAVTQRIRDGVNLAPDDVNLLGRFDAIVSAVLDEAYERADQQYRNWAKVFATAFAVLLAVWAAILVSAPLSQALLVGLLATPLAPVAKDLSSTLQAAAKAVGAVKR
jgi:hypothetical protein